MSRTTSLEGNSKGMSLFEMDLTHPPSGFQYHLCDSFKQDTGVNMCMGRGGVLCIKAIFEDEYELRYIVFSELNPASPPSIIDASGSI